MLTFWLQFAVVLAAILLGMRRGGVALGMIGGFGVLVLTLVFRIKPTEPPILVMLIILAVVTASAVLEVAGGLQFLVQVAERLLRRHPKRVAILAPFVTFSLTVCVGTGHAVYTLYPVIADVALRTGIRPERPMAVSAIASQMGIVASPVAAAVTTFLGLAANTPNPVGLIDILKVTVPASLIGVLAAALWSVNRGKGLNKDPEFLARLKDPAYRESLEISVTSLGKPLPRTAKPSVAIFLTAIASIVVLALFPQVLPSFDGKPVPLTTVVQMVMLSAGAVLLFATGARPADVVRSSVFTAGMVAVVAIFGIAWMSDTFVKGNQDIIVGGVKRMVEYSPWTFGLAMFAVSAFVKSQAATVAIMIPFGLALGLPTTVLLGVLPACYAHFFFCTYPGDLAAMSMDPTGTTRIGRYLLNHSFMMPGLIGVGVATTVGYFLSRLFFPLP
jgi:anaerobic C4-dicarboxylate transporter DcuB